jgi:arylsulfatase A-like enzyme
MIGIPKATGKSHPPSHSMRETLAMNLKPIMLAAGLFACLTAWQAAAAESTPRRPNFLVIFTDDQGYGDLGCYGSETLRTPRIDQLAKEGTRFTSFYAQVVCGPSRSALLTGRYPVRSLGWSMPASEITIAEKLKEAGYATGCVGKWDVSNRAAVRERMPNAQGFDYYYGTLGANDNGRVTLHENNQQVGQTDDMASLTRVYTDKSIEFLTKHKDQPFFLYLAHTMVHSVIDASEEFRGKSRGGLYGDTVEELDFHTGRLLDALDKLGLADNTLVIFTTDNGPWNNLQENLRKKHNGQIAWGSSGPLREGKGSTYEGGIRVPCIARWPGRVPAGQTSDAIFATIDFLPTFAALAGFPVPADRAMDGIDQAPLLLGQRTQGREDYLYFCQGELHAIRKGNWKLILPDRKKFYGYIKDKGSGKQELYDLETDIGEKTNLAQEHPQRVKELLVHAKSIPLPDEPYYPGIPLPAKPPRQNQ